MSPPPAPSRRQPRSSSRASGPSFSVFSLREYGSSPRSSSPLDPASNSAGHPVDQRRHTMHPPRPSTQQHHQQHHQQQQQRDWAPMPDTHHHHREWHTPDPPAQPENGAHRVYNLSCRHCERFLSDRGMRAVLLLRPSIVLFSSDAQPINAAPLPAYDELHTDVERTCLCLTQSLACFGCGTVCGYNIIKPCSRCIDSVSHQARSSNNHRYVFHADEIVATERRYIPGEPSVLPQKFLRSPQSSPIPDHAAHPAGHVEAATDVSRLGNPSEGSFKLDPGREPFQPRQMATTASGQRHDSRPRTPVLSTGLREGDVLFWHHLKSWGEQQSIVDPSDRVRSRPAR